MNLGFWRGGENTDNITLFLQMRTRVGGQNHAFLPPLDHQASVLTGQTSQLSLILHIMQYAAKKKGLGPKKQFRLPLSSVVLRA